LYAHTEPAAPPILVGAIVRLAAGGGPLRPISRPAGLAGPLRFAAISWWQAGPDEAPGLRPDRLLGVPEG
ncbi:MAG: hypothetical protein ACRDHL_14295, partial [Candidatus Promineifilaceae bacterium]